MNHGVLALLTRSLSIRGRSVSTYVSRFFLVLFLFIVTFVVKTEAESNQYAAPGLTLFRALTFINIGFIALYTMAFFTSTITEEKEEGTLGLLRMTKLSPVAIILGKSGARMLDVILLLGTQLPFTLLSITLGGIAFEQIIAMYISLGAFLFLAFNVAIFFSVVCQRTRSASGMTFLFFLMFFIWPYLSVAFIKSFDLDQNPGIIVDNLIKLTDHSMRWSILISLKKILSTDYDGSFINTQVGNNILFGLIFFYLSLRSFTFFNYGQPIKAAQRSILLTRRSLLTNQRRRVWSNAVLWKEFFFLSGGPPIFFAKILGYLTLTLLVFGALAYHDLNLTNAGVPLLVLFAAVAFIEIGLLAGRVFREELKWQTWPTLTLLPISVNQLFYQKILGAALSLTPVFFFMIFSMLLNPSETEYFFTNKRQEWFIANVVGATVLFAHGVLLISLYVRQGAFALSLGLVATLNLILFFGLDKYNTINHHELKQETTLLFVLFINLALSIFFHIRSRKRLHDLVSIG